jgi:hypothetical protein
MERPPIVDPQRPHYRKVDQRSSEENRNVYATLLRLPGAALAVMHHHAS